MNDKTSKEWKIRPDKYAMVRKNPHKGIRGWPEGTKRSPEQFDKGWDTRRKKARLEQSIILKHATADDYRALAALEETEA